MTQSTLTEARIDHALICESPTEEDAMIQEAVIAELEAQLTRFVGEDNPHLPAIASDLYDQAMVHGTEETGFSAELAGRDNERGDHPGAPVVFYLGDPQAVQPHYDRLRSA